MVSNKKKIFNDPVYGFISIPDALHFDLVEHRYFQRLRRIKQLGLTHLVYPGALHTRFHHSLGAMYLMQQALHVLRSKGHQITKEEGTAASLAILLHDTGHGPYSHTLEQTIVKGVSHEAISLLMMQKLNAHLSGNLDEAIAIFKGEHPKRFLSNMVSSQFDMDRLDYLKRDSFFTGVTEGNVNVERLLIMLDVIDNELVIEAKGVYSIEKFLVARRLMYWQVYLHKTVLSAEFMLTNALNRAKELSVHTDLWATPALQFFLKNATELSDFVNSDESLEQFSQLDDFDVFTALKVWSSHPDKILSYLSKSIVNRHLFKVEIRPEAFEPQRIDAIRLSIMRYFNLTEKEANYLLIIGETSNHAYHPNQSQINILYKDGSIKDISSASDQLNISVLSHPVTKHFICYPKELGIIS
jgi:HD superfamily phosphohydrolase